MFSAIRHGGSKECARAAAQRFGIDCVLLTCFDARFQFWAPFFRPSGIRIHWAQTIHEADFLLTVTEATVLLTDVLFLDGLWNDALTMAGRCHPSVVTVILAEEVDRPFVADAFAAGAFGVLWNPVELAGLRRTIQFADEASRDRAAYRVMLQPIAAG